MMEGQLSEIESDSAERMHVGMADPAPIVEFDSELERALGAAEKVVFVEAQRAVENSGFAES